MTPERTPREGRRGRGRVRPTVSGPGLRGRLMWGFSVVTVLAVALVGAAGLIGSSAGLSAQQGQLRRAAADRAAAVAAPSLARRETDAGAWSEVTSIARGAGARVLVRDATDTVLFSTTGMGGGHAGGTGRAGRGPGAGTPYTRTVAPGGVTLGSVTLVFPGSTQEGRPVAWRWVGAAAGLALGLALLAAWLITRSLTRPLTRITTMARAFAAGDRGARTGMRGRGELVDLAQAFDAAALQVQASEQARRALTADVAHELRTPLAALQAGLEELRDGLAPADPAALARLHDQSLRLGRVVADLAELSSADAARLTLKARPEDLTEVVASTVREFEPQLRAAGLTLVTQLAPGVDVVVDAGRIHQVLANLLGNCARHCREGDTVTVRLERGDGGRVLLVVADDGPGIDERHLAHVFTRFWRQGDGAGSGLGLAIVKALAEAHGGSVEVTSAAGKGTAVAISLPQ